MQYSDDENAERPYYDDDDHHHHGGSGRGDDDELSYNEHLRYSTSSYHRNNSGGSYYDDDNVLQPPRNGKNDDPNGLSYNNDDEKQENMRYSTSSSSYHHHHHHRKSGESYYNDDNVLRPHDGNHHKESSSVSHSSRYSGGGGDSSSKYHHNNNNNKRLSRTSRHSADPSHSSRHRQDRTSHATTARMSHASAKVDDTADTIAIFGAYGITGHYFLKLALEAGYNVRVLLLPGIALDDMEGNDKLTIVTGAFDDELKVRRVVRKASYVVCMLNDCDHTLQNSIPPSNFDFIQRLLPILDECQKCKVLLYQASSYALDATGATPMLSSICKKMAMRKAKRDVFQEQDKIVKYICQYHASSSSDPEYDEDEEETFSFIITRPSELVWDRPSRKKLAASKSLPGPFPITNNDLAEFSLNALKMEKLYNSCPYVVQDGV